MTAPSPANVSALSNVVSGHTTQQVNPITIHNPWVVNDRTADTRSLQTMAATFGKRVAARRVIPGVTDQDRAINEYNNFKRRIPLGRRPTEPRRRGREHQRVRSFAVRRPGDAEFDNPERDGSARAGPAPLRAGPTPSMKSGGTTPGI